MEAEVTSMEAEVTPAPERRRRVLARVAGVSPSLVEVAEQPQEVEATPLPEKRAKQILARVAGVTPSRSAVARAMAETRLGHGVPSAKPRAPSEGRKKLGSRQANQEAPAAAGNSSSLSPGVTTDA